MRLASRLKIVTMPVIAAIMAAAFLQPVSAQSPAASYAINPASGSVRPNEIVNITISVNTTTVIDGASLHLTFSGGGYDGFESAGSPALSFVDYHADFNDLVFICNNNNCAPGSYQIATITARSGSSGTMSINFTPKETADPQLQPVAASGISGSYSISASAPASPASKNSAKKTVTVPQDDGNGGFTPLQITNDQYLGKLSEALVSNAQTEQTTNKSVWSAKNLLLIGFGIGAGLALFLFLLLKFFGNNSGDNEPPTTPGSIIYPGD